MKEENRQFIECKTIDEIPWNRLGTTYDVAGMFPKLFQDLLSGEKEKSENAAMNIWMHTEHQGTLWPVTPFAMIILHQILSKTDEVMVQRQILEIYIRIFESAMGAEQMERPEPLPSFSNLLQEEYLLPEEIAEDEKEAALEALYSEQLTDEAFYSCFHYSWIVLALSLNENGDRLKAVNDAEIDEKFDCMYNPEIHVFLQKLLSE